MRKLSSKEVAHSIEWLDAKVDLLLDEMEEKVDRGAVDAEMGEVIIKVEAKVSELIQEVKFWKWTSMLYALILIGGTLLWLIF